MRMTRFAWMSGGPVKLRHGRALVVLATCPRADLTTSPRSKMQHKLALLHQYKHTSAILGTWMAASYVLRLITLVRISNRAVASAFKRLVYPLWSPMVSSTYRV